MKKSLIFDIDGTLWDSTAIVAKGYNAYLEQIGHPELFVTADDLKRLFGRTMHAIADILFADFGVPERYDMMRGCMDMEHVYLEADPCRVDFPGVRETLALLAKDYDLYIVSNCQSGYPELLQEKMGIGHLIRGHLCFGDTGTSKGQTILTLMARHGIRDAIYIGDTQGDLEASRMAGIPFVFCRYGFGSPAEFDAAVEEFAQLPMILEGMT